MRLKMFATCLAAALMFAASGHADTFTFTFTPTGGSAFMFDISGGPDLSTTNSDAPLVYAQYTGENTAYFFGASEGVYFDDHFGYGPTPFNFAYVTSTGDEYLEDGPQLFSGTVDAPSFIPGTYNLVGDQMEGNGIGGTLVIDGTLAVTPEPSSLILLGTGAFGCALEARRRFSRKGRALARSLAAA